MTKYTDTGPDGRVSQPPKAAENRDCVEDWVDDGLLCAAGKREFRRGRYWFKTIKTGADFRSGMDVFRGLVSRHLKTGYLAIVEPDGSPGPAIDQLRFLAKIMVAAGYAPDVDTLFGEDAISLSIPAVCPVTGVKTEFEFFPVAFCPGHGNADDPLYDPSLSTPFLAINTTSDAFSFAMLVADTAERALHVPPWSIVDVSVFDQLLIRCVGAWQKMSADTIRRYGSVSEIASRSVGLSSDETTWLAPHRDPVFAEDVKETYRHEMPVIYAQRMFEKWRSVLFEGVQYTPGRDGQSGGMLDIEAALMTD